MTKVLEKEISKTIRLILSDLQDGDIIQDTNEYIEILSKFEWYIPEFLLEKYNFWKFESLDGMYSQRSFKIKDNEAFISGMCIFISDQMLTPFFIHLKINDSNDKFDFIKCGVGEKTSEGILKIPYESSKWSAYMLLKEIEEINWCYESEYLTED